jgi:hypothetical protein
MAAALILAAATPAFAADPLYVAFSEVCATPPADFDAMVAGAKAHGWEPIGFDDFPALQAFHDATFDEPEEDDPERVAPFHRVIAGGDMFLVAKRLDFDGSVWAQCNLYDFNSNAPLAYADLVSWLGQKGKIIGKLTFGFSADWLGPGEVPGEQWEINIRYNPPGGVMTNIDGFIGTAIASILRPASAATELP